MASCWWCDRHFSPRSNGGSPQRFCSSSCRDGFWSAARRWIQHAVDAGLMTADDLKSPETSVHAVLRASQSEPAPEPRNGSASPIQRRWIPPWPGIPAPPGFGQ